jgi:hypothetical protein
MNALGSRHTTLTLAIAALGATLAILSPNWRAALALQTYYGDGKRMTGSGTIAGSHVRHTFKLHCDPSEGPNRLEVTWGKGQSFELDELTEASCSDDPTIDSDSAPAGFDTHEGRGSGTMNGAPATVEWTFTDGGHRGKDDFAAITITDDAGNEIAVSGMLKFGNHVAHGE